MVGLQPIGNAGVLYAVWGIHLVAPDSSWFSTPPTSGENDRAAACSVARQLDVPCGLIEGTAERLILKRRIQRRQGDKNEPSDATVDVLRQQIASREPLTESERDTTLTVDSADPGCSDETIEHL